MTNNTDRLTGWVYFIRSGDAIKIGFSIRPIMRVSELQPGNQFELELLGEVPTSVITERRAHEKFDHLHIRGEWFRAEGDLMEYIAGIEKPVPEITIRRNPTKPRPKPYMTPEIRALIAKRNAYGAETPMGHRCSNIVGLLENNVGATDRQKINIDKSLAVQIRDLEQLTANAH